MQTYNNMPLTWPELANTNFGVSDFDLSKALNGWPLVAISNGGSTIQPATKFRAHDGHVYATVDGQEITFSETGKAILVQDMSLKIAEADQGIIGTEPENTPDTEIEVSSFGPLEQFAMGAFQGILSSIGTNPLELTPYQITQASDRAWAMANAMMNSATSFKKQHKLRSATYPGVHNTVNASRTDQLLADIAKQLVELNKNLSVDILKVKKIDDEKLELGIGNDDPEHPWTEPEDDLNENIDDIKKEVVKNPNLYSISELLFLQRRELKDLASYCRIKETDENHNTTTTPLVKIVKKIQDALWQETPSTVQGQAPTEKSYIDVISGRLDKIIESLKMPDTPTSGNNPAVTGDSITKVLSKTLKDIGEMLGVPDSSNPSADPGGMVKSLTDIKTALNGIKSSLTATTILGDKAAAQVLIDHTDKLEGIRQKLETIGNHLTDSGNSLASLATARNSKLSEISGAVSGQQTTLNSISSTASGILSTVGSINSTETSISGKLDTTNSEVTAIKGNTATTAARIDTANTNLETINTSIINK